MVRHEVVRLVDDLDGSEAVETIEFGLQGKLVEIDLNEANAARLRDALAPFVAAARRSDGRRPPAEPKQRHDTTAIRTWLREHGYEIGDRGRIPNNLMAAYETRTPAPPQQEPTPVVEPEPHAENIEPDDVVLHMPQFTSA